MFMQLLHFFSACASPDGLKIPYLGRASLHHERASCEEWLPVGLNQHMGLKSVVGKSKLSCILFDCTALCLFSQLV